MSEEKEDDNEICIACGDNADSADELQKLIEEKKQEDDKDE